jgi:transaldolase
VARTIDTDLDEARSVLEAVRAVGVDLDEVAATLESEGVASFEKSFDDLLATLETKRTAD